MPGTYGDVRFADLMDDPVAAIARRVRGDRARADRRAPRGHHRYLAAKPRGKHGTHRYTAEDWGFDAAALLRADLADYMDSFAVPVEPS